MTAIIGCAVYACTVLYAYDAYALPRAKRLAEPGDGPVARTATATMYALLWPVAVLTRPDTDRSPRGPGGGDR